MGLHSVYILFSSFKVIILTIFCNILALSTSIYAIQVFNRYIIYGIDATLYTLAIGTVTAVSFEFIFRALRSASIEKVIYHHLQNKRNHYIDIVFDIGYEYYIGLTENTKRIVKQFPEDIKVFFNSSNISIALDFPFLAVFLLAILLINDILFFITISLMFGVLLTNIALIYYQKIINKNINKSQTLINYLYSSGSNIPVFQNLFQSKEIFKTNSKLFNNDLDIKYSKLFFFKSLNQSFNIFLISLANIILIGIGAKLVVDGVIAIGALIGVNILATRILSGMVRYLYFLDLFSNYQRSNKVLKSISRLPKEKTDGSALRRYSGSIKIVDVTHFSRNKNHRLFQPINFNVIPGSIISIRGPAGIGKSLLFKILISQVTPHEGNVLVDGINLTQVSKEWWRSQFSYLPQTIQILEGTFLQNLIVHDKNLSFERINMVMNYVGLREMISGFENGFEQYLSSIENYSSSFINRLGLARALIPERKVYFLDDPFLKFNEDEISKVFELINNLKNEGKSIWITGDENIITKFSDQTLMLG